MEDCSICCYPFNKVLRKQIECLKCNQKMCNACVKKFLLSTLEDPYCMHCKHPWDLFFINKVLSKNFLSKEWKSSRSELLFNREKSFFPDTMPLVSLEIEKEKIYTEITSIENKIHALKHRKTILSNRLYQIVNHRVQSVPDKNKAFSIRQCPFSNCKGFIDEKGSCPICGNISCLKCNIVKTEIEHECDEKDIETWQEIQKMSKPCPNCGTRIQKASGCSQMWCPGCHVAFNWNTGQIEKGAVHNPHFYEWAERLGINPTANINNNQMCNQYRVWNYYNYTRIVPVDKKIEFRNLHQRLNHIINNDITRMRDKVGRNNTDLRIKYLRNQMDEEKYKKILVQREVGHQKMTRILEIYETLNMLIVPLFDNFLNKTLDYQTLLLQIKDLEKFVNDNIQEINKTFHSDIGNIILF